MKNKNKYNVKNDTEDFNTNNYDNFETDEKISIHSVNKTEFDKHSCDQSYTGRSSVSNHHK